MVATASVASTATANQIALLSILGMGCFQGCVSAVIVANFGLHVQAVSINNTAQDSGCVIDITEARFENPFTC
jgi:hypothetical protein